ncbi:MAG: hypothetical protein JWP89_1550 [Schlesneria sp.]|nr:hypothetical protein [Schlesneria sp.]
MSTAAGVQPWVVLHADDFGMNAAVNAGIVQGFRDGFLTSTSILANAPAVSDACAAWPLLIAELREGAIPSATIRRQGGDTLRPFDLGVHLNLTQGRPLTSNYPTELLGEQGQFPGIGPVFRKLRTERSRFRQAVLSELQAQVERVRALGVEPTHLNGHQYVELVPEVASLIPDLAAKYSIPIVRLAKEGSLARTVLWQGRVVSFAVALVKRYFAGRFQKLIEREGLIAPSQFFGTSHAGHVDKATLIKFLTFASPAGCTEIGLHPGVSAIESPLVTDDWYDPLATARPAELDWLCDVSTSGLFSDHGLRLGRLTDLLSA